MSQSYRPGPGCWFYFHSKKLLLRCRAPQRDHKNGCQTQRNGPGNSTAVVPHDINTKGWYNGEDRIDPVSGKPIPRLYKLEESGYDGVVRKPEEVIPKTVAALTRAFEWGDKIPIGVFYKNELLSTYQERISQRITTYPGTPPAKEIIADNMGEPVTSIKKMLDELKVTG